MAFTISDVGLIAATSTGPILAVQVQKWIERAKVDYESRLRIFKTLMMTRATQLAPDHIRALNMITIGFRGDKFTKVRSAGKAISCICARSRHQTRHNGPSTTVSDRIYSSIFAGDGAFARLKRIR